MSEKFTVIKWFIYKRRCELSSNFLSFFQFFFPSASHCPAVLMVGSLKSYCALEVSPEQHDGKIASEFLSQMGPN